ncbi:MAG: AraC family transcriptional regulator [Verrucomicrobiae bacterium]|nr:AraC family transcriptional regulator [Verrucomicrobiae bacterium]
MKDGQSFKWSDQLPVVRTLGAMIFDPIWARDWHRANCCELIHVSKGQVRIMTKQAEFAAGPGEVVLLPDGILHRDVFDSRKGLEVFYLSFEWGAAASYFSTIPWQNLAALSRSAKLDVANALGQLKADFTGGAPPDQLLVRVRLLNVLLLVLAENLRAQRPADVKPSIPASRAKSLMTLARQYIQAHYHESLNLEKIAQALKVSPYHLSHVFSRESDFSLFEYITHLRMEKAQQLLVEGKANVSEAASAVGYDDGNYFSKVFRRHFGHPPSGVFRAVGHR